MRAVLDRSRSAAATLAAVQAVVHRAIGRHPRSSAVVSRGVVGDDRQPDVQPRSLKPGRDPDIGDRIVAVSHVSRDPAPAVVGRAPTASSPDARPTADPAVAATSGPPAAWVPWIFAAKTTASALLALLIAFRFDLDEPKWALLTVFIIAQPQSGFVLAKSFYRIVGTLVGASGALLLVSAFAQERVLFLGSLAIWLGACTYASKRARGFASYGFVLAGYTVAIVGIPGALAPDTAFYIASARVTEVVLAIVVTAAISHLILPVSLGLALRRAVRAARQDLAFYAHAALSGEHAGGSELALLRRAMEIEEMRRSAVFEDREVRTRSLALREFVIRFTAVFHVAQMLDRTLLGARGSGEPQLARAMSMAAEAITRWSAGAISSAELAACFTRVRAKLPLVRDLCREASGVSDNLLRQAVTVSKVRELLDAFANFAAAWQAFSAGGPPAQQSRPWSRSRDNNAAVWAGLRAALALIGVSVFWITAAWPSGSTATILAGVVAARGATMERSAIAAAAMSVVVAVSSIPLFLLVEVLLPNVDGFVAFAIAVAPVLFVCAYLMADRRTMVIGFMSALYLASISAFQNRMAYDALGFLNTSIATVVAIAVAAVMFAVVAPETAAAARHRFTRVSRRLLRRIAGRHPLTLVEFDTAMAAALEHLLQHLRPERSDDVDTLNSAVALASFGRELIRLREVSPNSFPAIAVDLVSELCRGRTERAWNVADQSAERCLVILADETLAPGRAQAIARDMIALATVRNEIEQVRFLLGPEQPSPEIGHAA